MKDGHGAILDALIGHAITRKIFPGAVLTIAAPEGVVVERAWGRLTYCPWAPQTSPDTLFDLASLTKPLATSCAVLALIARGKLFLDTYLSDIFGKVPSEKAGITVFHLLCHLSGLSPCKPFYPSPHDTLDTVQTRSCSLGDRVIERILSDPLEAPTGSRGIYSDLGFILLGKIIEIRSGMSLDQAVFHLVYAPLGIEGLSWKPMEAFRTRPSSIAPTQYCSLRNRVIWGEVNDLNAWTMGGIAGHAGLFGTGKAVARLLLKLLALYKDREENPNFPKELIRTFWTPANPLAGSWALGFDTPTPGASSSGRLFSSKTVGHLGFTGTSFWMDIERGIAIIFLSNRTFPHQTTESQEGMKRLRPRLYDLAMQMALDRAQDVAC